MYFQTVFLKILHITFGREVIHHSHITGKIMRYGHSFCNQNVRENKNQVSVIALNLSGFSFFFFKKRLREELVKQQIYRLAVRI